MEITKLLVALRAELNHIDAAILNLERLQKARPGEPGNERLRSIRPVSRAAASTPPEDAD